MDIKYIESDSLERISEYATNKIPEGKFLINLILPFRFKFSTLRDNPLEDVTDLAKAWAQKERPEELYFSHGEFIKDGLEHIIGELKKKYTSNRALFSLISQKHISKTDDEPIPSFMIMQCNIHEGTLFCSTYFRALEVSTFLRINLEEIRLKICEIHKKIPTFDNVDLTIFAFRAYSNKSINTLQIPKIERISESAIYKMLERTPQHLSDLLKDMLLDATVVSTKSLNHILNALIELDKEKLKFNHAAVKITTNEAISIANELRNQRKINSHNEYIKTLSNQFKEKIKKIIIELEHE